MKRKPLAGHRFGGLNYGASARCECGWQSATWYGKGARSNAYAEWHCHIDTCLHHRRSGI